MADGGGVWDLGDGDSKRKGGHSCLTPVRPALSRPTTDGIQTGKESVADQWYATYSALKDTKALLCGFPEDVLASFSS